MSQVLLQLSQHPSPRVRGHGAQVSAAIAVPSGISLPALRASLRYWWHRLRCSWRYAAALRELRALDPLTLKDVGLNRGDLHAIAYATARLEAMPLLFKGDDFRLTDVEPAI